MHTQGVRRVLMIVFTTLSKMSKWHKYLIPIFKFELDLWGNIHHTNFSYLTIRHLGKTNHLGSLYSKRGETETSTGWFSGSDRKTNKKWAVLLAQSSVRWRCTSSCSSYSMTSLEHVVDSCFSPWLWKDAKQQAVLKCLTFLRVKLNEMNPPSLSISVLKYFAIKDTEAAILEQGFQDILRKNLPLVVLKLK